MAAGDFFESMKQKVRSVYNNFFYDGEEAPAPAPMQEEAFAPVQEQPVYQQPAGYQQAYPQNNYQQQPYQQGYAAPQPAYQPAAPQMQFSAPQVEAQQFQARNRRSVQHAQSQSNVVDFNAYQQTQRMQQPQQPAPEAEPAVPPALPGTRVINARGMGDCRSAITLLREGDAVLIVLENITDPSEMRRLVDTLSGACYSLTATITKVSRGGVYLLAPQSMAVYTDQITNQMNGAPARNHAYQPAAQQQSAAPYGQMQYASAPAAPNYNPQPQQQGFMQRAAAPAAGAQPFYARTAPQSAQVPDFNAQQAAAGYVPDEYEVGNQ